MGRYENTRMEEKLIRRGKDKSLYKIMSYSSTVYSTIPRSDNDLFVLTQHGDRLDLLAQRFYGDVSLWWYIAKANGLTFMTVSAGTRLRIPSTTQYAIGK